MIVIDDLSNDHCHSRVKEAFALSAMEREDMLSRQSALVHIHKQMKAKELQALKDEIIRLSR